MGKSILTANQKRLLDRATASDWIADSFYLTGGTALSEYYFQHRLSEDLDFFSEHEFDDKLLIHWARSTRDYLHADIVEQQKLRGQLVFFFHFNTEVVKVDFAYFPFEHLGSFKRKGSLKIASIEDIATNKLQALLSRNRARDYFDLYKILLSTSLDIKALKTNYVAKFGITVSDLELAKVFAKILEAQDLPRFLGTVDWKLVENYFLKLARKK